jgi:hypothetical protein
MLLLDLKITLPDGAPWWLLLLLPLSQLLGRADNVKEYIKRGAVEGWVEVTLSGGPGQQDTRVRRTMKKEADGKYSSQYRINGEGAGGWGGVSACVTVQAIGGPVSCSDIWKLCEVDNCDTVTACPPMVSIPLACSSCEVSWVGVLVMYAQQCVPVNMPTTPFIVLDHAPVPPPGDPRSNPLPAPLQTAPPRRRMSRSWCRS